MTATRWFGRADPQARKERGHRTRQPHDTEHLPSGSAHRTHQVDDLTELYDSVVVIRDGRLCFEGSVEAFMSQAPHASDRPVEAAYLRVIESAR